MAKGIIRYELAAVSFRRDGQIERPLARRVGDHYLQPGTVLAELRIIHPNCTPEWLADAILYELVTASTKNPGQYELVDACKIGDAHIQMRTAMAELTMIDPNCTPSWWMDAIRRGLITPLVTKPERDPANADT